MNKQLLDECKQNSKEEIIKKERWKWIGHVLRKEPNCDTRSFALDTGRQAQVGGGQRITWCRTVEAEMKAQAHTWGTVQKVTQDKQGWRSFVDALHASRQA